MHRRTARSDAKRAADRCAFEVPAMGPGFLASHAQFSGVIGYMYMYLYIYIYIYMYIQMCTHMYIERDVCIDTCVYIYIHRTCMVLSCVYSCKMPPLWRGCCEDHPEGQNTLLLKEFGPKPWASSNNTYFGPSNEQILPTLGYLDPQGK